MRKLIGIAGLAVLTALASQPQTLDAAEPWSRFRGPNGSGVSPATTIPVQWTDKDYRWKAKLPGVGHSCPVLWGDRVFVTSADNETGKRFVLCYHAKDGSRRWQREFDGVRHG